MEVRDSTGDGMNWAVHYKARVWLDMGSIKPEPGLTIGECKQG